MPTVPVLARGTYGNGYRWRGSDAEFICSVSTGGGSGGGRREAAAVDSFSCRQAYLRSYTFTKKRASITAKSRRRFLRTVRKRVLLLAAFYRRIRKGKGKKKKGCGALVKEKFKYGSFSALRYVLGRLFSVTRQRI